MRIIGKNSKGKKVLITVPDWNMPPVVTSNGNGNTVSNTTGSNAGS